MRNIDKWVKGKPGPVSLAAKLLTPMIGSVCELGRELRSQETDEWHSGMNLSHWLDFYRKPATFRGPVYDMFSGAGAWEELKRMKRQPIAVPPDDELRLAVEQGGIAGVLEVIPQAAQMMGSIAARIDELLCRASGNQSRPDISDEQEPIVYFMLSVQIPCWLTFAVQPSRLFHRARGGNHDALEQLLWLDKSVLADRCIGQHWHRIMKTGSRALRRRFYRAMQDEPKPELTPRRARIVTAAMVSLVADLCLAPLSTDDIRNLFLAMARDLEKRSGDADLPGEDKALYRAVAREKDRLRKLWPKLSL